MSKENKNTANGNVFANVISTLWRWTKRMVVGVDKEMTDEERFAVEQIESPSVMAVKAFFRRKLAVVALVVLVSLFLLVFILWNMFKEKDIFFQIDAALVIVPMVLRLLLIK